MIEVATGEPRDVHDATQAGGSRRTGGVQLANVTARLGATTAVDEVTLDVEPGELLVLVGPSGCGKTTLLRIIAGLEDPTSGSVSIDGRHVNDVDPKDRDVAMVFQSYALYPHLTVAENIAFPLRKRGVARRDRGPLVAEAASLVAISDLLDRKPATLSGGQRQRVALARAIVRRPSVFLMDEPLSNLDAPTRADARAQLTALHARLGITVLYVTHDQVEALTMGSRLAVMRDGRLQQVGAPDDVYAAPANTFVARFLGSPGMNLVAGSIDAGGMAVDVGDATLALATRIDAVGDVIVGVRPEHLSVSDHGLQVEVQAVESHGHERVVRATTSGGEDVRFRVTTADATAVPGRTLRLTAAATDLHVFDLATGLRMAGHPT